MNLKKYITEVPNYPIENINFKDITSLLLNADIFSYVNNELARVYMDYKIDLVCGVEARGFIFGAVLAQKLGAGFVPIRKANKLPRDVLYEEYELEYGENRIEIHKDAIQKGQSVILVDDLLATGGTMKACCNLIEKLQGNILGISFLIELSFLKGKEKIHKYPIHTLISY